MAIFTMSCRPAVDVARVAALTLLACSFICLTPLVSFAGCNAIPAAWPKAPYRSTKGGINERMALPGATVTVTNDVCDASALAFNKNQATKVKLEFLGCPTKNHEFIATSRVFPGCTGSSCASVQFALPNTSELESLNPPHGLAGPMKMVVMNEASSPGSTDQVVAEIDTLLLPESGCPPSSPVQDPLFGHFIFLPEANKFATTAAGSSSAGKPFLATLDLKGNLLIPLNFKAQLQDTQLPVATLLAANSPDKAITGQPQTIGQNIGTLENPGRQLRAFTPDGRPIPPLMRVTETGLLFGLVDTETSVLRIARFEEDVSGGPELFQVDDRISGNCGPVKLNYMAQPGTEIPVPLITLRTSRQTIAYARDEAYEEKDINSDGDQYDLVPEVINVENGIRNKIDGSASVVPSVNVFMPLLEVAGPLVTFLEPKLNAAKTMIEQHVHRVFGNNGTEIAASPPRPASTVARIGNSPVGISGTESGLTTNYSAFYLDPKGTHDELAAVRVPGGSPVTTNLPITQAAIAGGHVVMLVSESLEGSDINEDGDKFDQIVYFYGLPSNDECAPMSLGVAADDVAISEKIVVAAVSEHDQGGASLNGDGDGYDAVVHLWSVPDLVTACINKDPSPAAVVIPYAADTIAAWDDHAVFITPEYGQNTSGVGECGPTDPPGGCDLNKDEDPNDRVLMIANLSGYVQNSHHAAEEFELGEYFIAFRVPEEDQGNLDLNNDADRNDAVMHIYFPYCLVSKVINTEWSAIPCSFAGCDPRHPYRVEGRLVWFITDDRQAVPMTVAAAGAYKCELIGVFSDMSAHLPPEEIFPWQPSTLPPFPQWFVDQLVLFGSTVPTDTHPVSRLTLVGDVDGDTFLDPFDNCVEFPNPGLLDVDGDGIGDRYCDPTPSACPERPIPQDGCVGPKESVQGGLCVESDARGLRLAWNWRMDEYKYQLPYWGDPIRELPHYSVCVYPHNGHNGPALEAAVLPWDECGEPPCWKETREKGFIYEGDGKLAGTLDRLGLLPANGQKPQIFAAGSFPEESRTLAAALGRQNTVQLIARVRDKLHCWSSTHEDVLGTLAECPDPTREPKEERR